MPRVSFIWSHKLPCVRFLTPASISQDNFHYWVSDFIPLAARCGFEVTYVGDWGHESSRLNLNGRIPTI